MEQTKEAVYLINDDKYLHLRENGAGVGFATYNKVTGEPLESGQISEKNLPPGTGICLNFRTMTVWPSNRKA